MQVVCKHFFGQSMQHRWQPRDHHNAGGGEWVQRTGLALNTQRGQELQQQSGAGNPAFRHWAFFAAGALGI